MIIEVTELAKSIDSTLLKANASEGDVRSLCDVAKKHNFASVVVNPTFVKMADEILKDAPVRVGTVVGFPLGASTTTEKCFETINNIVNGACEIDFVMNLGYLKSAKYDEFYRDAKAVVLAAKRGQMKSPGKTIFTKMILETCYLSKDEIKIACKVAEKAAVDFVKTSTGFGSEGATEENVELLRKILPTNIGIKASGGIKEFKQADKFLDLGASRLGTSSAEKIMQEYATASKVKAK